MFRSRLTLISLLLLSATVIVGCSTRRGGGGGGGGGASETAEDGTQTGPGKNVGDASLGGSLTGLGEGSATLYVVNYSGGTIEWVEGFQCSESDWFMDEGVSLRHGEYIEVTNLIEGCWNVRAYPTDSDSVSHEIGSLSGEYTWRIGAIDTGDDVDAGDDDDDVDPLGNVSITNNSEYEFYEVAMLGGKTPEEWFDVCSPFGWEETCWLNTQGQVVFVAFTQEGRSDNSSNCWMTTGLLSAEPDDLLEVEFTGGELECAGE